MKKILSVIVISILLNLTQAAFSKKPSFYFNYFVIFQMQKIIRSVFPNSSFQCFNRYDSFLGFLETYFKINHLKSPQLSFKTTHPCHSFAKVYQLSLRDFISRNLTNITPMVISPTSNNLIDLESKRLKSKKSIPADLKKILSSNDNHFISPNITERLQNEYLTDNIPCLCFSKMNITSDMIHKFPSMLNLDSETDKNLSYEDFITHEGMCFEGFFSLFVLKVYFTDKNNKKMFYIFEIENIKKLILDSLNQQKITLKDLMMFLENPNLESVNNIIQVDSSVFIKLLENRLMTFSLYTEKIRMFLDFISICFPSEIQTITGLSFASRNILKPEEEIVFYENYCQYISETDQSKLSENRPMDLSHICHSQDTLNDRNPLQVLESSNTIISEKNTRKLDNIKTFPNTPQKPTENKTKSIEKFSLKRKSNEKSDSADSISKLSPKKTAGQKTPASKLDKKFTFVRYLFNVSEREKANDLETNTDTFQIKLFFKDSLETDSMVMGPSGFNFFLLKAIISLSDNKILLCSLLDMSLDQLKSNHLLNQLQKFNKDHLNRFLDQNLQAIIERIIKRPELMLVFDYFPSTYFNNKKVSNIKIIKNN